MDLKGYLKEKLEILTYGTCEISIAATNDYDKLHPITIGKYFVEWKMNGIRDYVLGLEPGNCLPDGRNVMRTKNILDFIKPNEKKEFNIKIEIME